MESFFDTGRRSFGGSDGGHVRDLVLDRHHPDTAVVDLAQPAHRRIDDKRDFAVADKVGDIGTSLIELVDQTVFDTVGIEEFTALSDALFKKIQEKKL